MEDADIGLGHHCLWVKAPQQRPGRDCCPSLWEDALSMVGSGGGTSPEEEGCSSGTAGGLSVVEGPWYQAPSAPALVAVVGVISTQSLSRLL